MGCAVSRDSAPGSTRGRFEGGWGGAPLDCAAIISYHFFSPPPTAMVELIVRIQSFSEERKSELDHERETGAPLFQEESLKVFGTRAQLKSDIVQSRSKGRCPVAVHAQAYRV